MNRYTLILGGTSIYFFIRARFASKFLIQCYEEFNERETQKSKQLQDSMRASNPEDLKAILPILYKIALAKISFAHRSKALSPQKVYWKLVFKFWKPLNQEAWEFDKIIKGK